MTQEKPEHNTICNNNLDDFSLASHPQLDMKENNDLLKAILDTMQSIDKNVKKIQSKKPSYLQHDIEENDTLAVDLESKPTLNKIDPLNTTEYKLGDALSHWVDLLHLVEQDSELLSILPLNLNHTAAEDAQTIKDYDQAVNLVTLIACLAQWDKVTAIWEMLAERCRQDQRPVTKNELHILVSAVNIHNLTWRDKNAKLQSVDCPITFNYKLHQRGNMRGETITAEWLPTLINPGATSTLNALVYTQ